MKFLVDAHHPVIGVGSAGVLDVRRPVGLGQLRGDLFDRHVDAVVVALEEARFVELFHDRLTVHGDH